MNLSREDVLRELELLPVWKLREPQKTVLPEKSVAPMDQVLVEPTAPLPLAIAALPDTPFPENAEKAVQEWLTISSDDDALLFILEPDLSADAETLLQNMLRAIAVQPKTRVVGQFNKILNEYAPQLLIAMGEGVAQVLLADKNPLEQLRSKVHEAKGLALIVTYSPAHLLNHPADKAKAWQDLCLAIAHLQMLSAQP